MTKKEQRAIDKINEVLALDLCRTYSKTLEFKGYKFDYEDGGRCKFYLDRSDLQELASMFRILAEASEEEVTE